VECPALEGDGEDLMSASTKAPAAAVGFSAGLIVLVLLFYALTLATLADLAGSDPAGNALARAYGAIEVIALWLLLATLVIIAWAKGTMPTIAAIAAAILVPASGFATMIALDLLAKPEVSPFLWPIAVPALVPPLIVAFCFWTLLPATHVLVPAAFAGAITWGAILVLCASILPMQQMRGAAEAKVTAAREKYTVDFATMPADSPLWEWVPFLATPDQTRVSNTLERIRRLERRQSDAELMLDRGDFPLGHIGLFDLTPSQSLCDKARALLRRRAEALVLKDPNSKPFTDITVPTDDAVAAMSWLIDYDCPCAAEAQAWETMAKAYRDPGYDIYRLAELRDPKRLGRALYENPERFSMLTPRAHLKAWLKFAEDNTVREQVLAGARKLDHRTSDAIEILSKDEFGTRVLLETLPVLDLDPTPELCSAALGNLHKQFGAIYRPKADDPRSYQELLGRLGRGEQFIALRWLALHGCDADTNLSEAESLIDAYQPSPDGGLILGQLKRLHRRP
jgi:hypothetical protein